MLKSPKIMQKMLHAVNETFFQNHSVSFKNKNSITAIQTKAINPNYGLERMEQRTEIEGLVDFNW